jgi:hypothetical protein
MPCPLFIFTAVKFTGCHFPISFCEKSHWDGSEAVDVADIIPAIKIGMIGFIINIHYLILSCLNYKLGLK